MQLSGRLTCVTQSSSASSCRICARPGLSQFSRRGRLYDRCRHCGAVTRRLSPEDYRRLNPSYDPGPIAAHGGKATWRKYLAVDDKKQFLKPLVDPVGRPCRLLDVGCGAGGFLWAGRELGCEVRGIEPSEAHSRIARELDLPVSQGRFEPGSLQEHSFEIVLLSHVIEHILEPAPFLEALAKLLVVGGKLVVVTPNAASLVAVLSERYWVMLKPVDHVSMLTEKSFRAMGLERFGLLEFSQGEHSWEPLTALALAAKDAAKELTMPEPATTTKDAVTDAKAPALGKPPALLWRNGLQGLRSWLSLGSIPLHHLAVRMGRQACLTMTLTRT